MRKATFSVLMFSILSISATVSAADRLKPGLWSMNMKSDAMKDREMPKISPEQAAQMKKMGMKIPEMQDGGMVMKVCMTKEMTERDQPQQMDQKNSGCEMKNFKRSGDSYTGEMVCDGPDMKGVGKIAGKYPTAESFNSTYDFKGTVQGQPANHHQETSGKWLSADCGDVKPAADYAKKK